jgi:PAS domain S-box-containing protein
MLPESNRPPEDALRRGDISFRRLFETATHGIFVADPAGRILECNQSAARLCGHAREDLVGRSLADLNPEFQPDGQPSAEIGAMKRAAALNGDGQRFEWQLRRADGSLIDVEISLASMREGAGDLLLAVACDVGPRKLDEARLRGSEAKLRAAFQNGPDTLFLTTVEEGRIVDVNGAFEGLFGYSREEAIGKTTRELGLYADPSERDKVVAEIKAAGRIANFILHSKRKSGEVFMSSLSMVMFMLDGVPHAAGSVRDVTVVRRADEILRRNEATLQTLLRISRRRTETVQAFIDYALGEAVALTGSGAGCIFEFDETNREFTLSGSSGGTQPAGDAADPRTCCGLAWGDVWTEAVDWRKAIVRNGFDTSGFSTAADPRGPVQPERLMVAPIFRDNAIVAVVGVANKACAYDEDDRFQLTRLMDDVWKSVGVRRAEQALKESNDRYLTITKCIPDKIWSIDLSGRFTYISPRVEHLHGWTVEECKNLTFRDFLVPGQADQMDLLLREEMEKALSPQGDRNLVRTFEIEQVRKDGTTFWTETSVSFIWSDDGKPVGLTGVTRDITDRKQGEAERQKLCAQLAQAQKMESVGRLAGGLGHDFNNWLTVINGYSKMALAGMDSMNPLCGQLKEILKAGERAAGLSRQLLAFSRKQVLHPRMLDLNSVVKNMGSMLGRLMGEDVELRFELTPDCPTVMADPHQLEQVIMNLAVNARDAMPGGGRLLLETTTVEQDESFPVPRPENSSRRYAVLAVTDTGMGMDEVTRLRVFEPFFTTKAAGQGTGLGLSMVQGIVTQSGGFVRIYSEPGRGTAFKIHLPLLSGQATEADKPAAGRSLRGRETVLVVEDQDAVRRFTVEALTEYGYRVVHAANAREALTLCDGASGRIDMILTDVVMPQVSGAELVTRLAKMRPGIKVLFMSGYTGSAIAQHGVLEEGVHFIQKPFSPGELAEKVRSILGPLAPPARIAVASHEDGVRSTVRTALERAGYQVVEAANGGQALRQALGNRVRLVIADQSELEREGNGAIQAVRRELPGVGLIAISGGPVGGAFGVAQALGADAVLETPVKTDLLLAEVAEALERRG